MKFDLQPYKLFTKKDVGAFYLYKTFKKYLTLKSGFIKIHTQTTKTIIKEIKMSLDFINHKLTTSTTDSNAGVF